MTTPYDRIIDGVRAITPYLRAIGQAANELEEERKALAAQLGGGPVVEPPPVVVDPPVVTPPPVSSVGAPDFSSYAFAPLMPAWRHYARPTEAECDWIIDGTARRAVSTKGLPTYTFGAMPPGVAGDLYRRSRAAGHGPRVTFGVRGDAGEANLGGYYDHAGAHDVTRQLPGGGWEALDVQFVGLSDDAAVQVRWGGSVGQQDWGYTKRLACFDIGIVGSPDGHGVTQNKPCGEIIFDNFWSIYPAVSPDGSWHSFMHLAQWEWLVLRGLKRRGRKPTDPGAIYQQMPFYLKHSTQPGSATWVIENDMRGGGAIAMQKRPGTDGPEGIAPGQDTMVCAFNTCDSHGWDRDQVLGGSVFSHWSSPIARAFYVGNSVQDARGGCFVASGQPLHDGHDRNWYDDGGYPIGELYVDGNTFTNPRGDRAAVSVSNARHVYWGDRNVVVGKMIHGSQWIAERPPVMPVGSLSLVGDPAKHGAWFKYDAAFGGERPMTTAERQAMLLPDWPVPVGF